MYYKIIQYCAYAALALPALPPLLTPFFQPYTFGKTALFEVLVECAALALLVSLFTKQHAWRFNLQASIAVAGFAVAAALSTLFSASPTESFWGSSARMDGLFTLLHFAAFFFVLTSTLREAEWRKLMRWSILVSAFVALYGIAQWFAMPFVRASEGTVFSTLGNPAYLATYALFHVFLSLFAAAQTLSRETKAAWAVVGALNAIVLVMTSVAGALVGFFVGIAVAAYPALRAHPVRALAVTLGVVLLVWTNASPQGLMLSLESRLRVWRIAGNAALEQPLFGHGPNQFESTFLAYKARGYPVPATGETFDKPHNAYLETLFSFGIIGFAAYLYLLWAALSRAHGLIRAALVGYLISLFFFFDTFSSLLIFFFLLAYLSRQENASAPPARISLHMALVILSGVAAFFFLFHFKPLYSAYWANRGVKDKALLYDSFNRPFIERAFLLEQNR